MCVFASCTLPACPLLSPAGTDGVRSGHETQSCSARHLQQNLGPVSVVLGAGCWDLGAGRGAGRDVGGRAERNGRPHSLVDRGPAPPDLLELEGGSAQVDARTGLSPAALRGAHASVPKASLVLAPKHPTQGAGSGETGTVLL